MGLAIALPAATAQAVTIDFDDLNAPGKDSGTGLPVNVQYSGQGVTFNDPSAFDYSKPTPIPGFAHSGTVAVEPCAGAEFCTSPVRASFTTAQRRVGVWVGFSSPLADPLGVRLTAYDAALNVVGTDDATLPANASPTPIQTPLSVEAPPARIVTAEVSVTTGGGFSRGLAVDDVEFSTAGPPPPCPATEPPFVTMASPPVSSTVHNNEFVLRGTVNHSGAPITSASVIATSSSGATRTASVYPTLINSEGGSYGPVRFNGILFDPAPGFHDIVVTATNCRGTGASDPRRVLWDPLPPSTRFRQLGPIEVTQAIQTTNNAVPLVAASPNGVKRTFARVYLQVQGGPNLVKRVSGSLTAVRPDGSRPPGPLRILSINPAPDLASIGSGPLQEQRSKLNDPLLFELPPEWLAAGQLHLELEHIYIEGAESSFPCDGCANIGVVGPQLGQLGPARVRFHRTPPLRLWLISMPYRLTPTGNPLVPSQLEIDTMASMVRRMYPTADLQLTPAILPVAGKPPETCKQARGLIADFVATIGPQDPRTRYLGLLPADPAVTVKDADGNQIGGCASSEGQNGWVFASDEFGGAHELGHMYGRRHVAGCQLFAGSSIDSGFPHPLGRIGSEGFGDALGLDAGDSALGINRALLDWRNGVTDVMTYCDQQWLSDYNYGVLRGRLCSEDPASCPNGAAAAGRSRGPESGRLARLGALQAARGRKSRARLQVRGTLSSSRRASLDSLLVLPGQKLSSRPKRSRYAIVLRGRGGRTIARYPFKPTEVGEDTIDSIEEVVPFKRATKRIAITRGRRTLDSARVSAHAPRVRVTQLKKGKGGATVKVGWRSRDADGGRRTYTLLYRPEGRRYIPVVARLRRRSFTVNLAQLPGGRRARFRVIAHDGVLTGSGDSRPITVASKAPRISIATPAAQAELAADQPVQFAASIEDLQDVRLSNVAWRSSIQGELGRGTAIAATLSPGRHEITATATNSAGRTSVASTQVTVTALPPVFRVP